jgi:hypothetical protein
VRISGNEKPIVVHVVRDPSAVFARQLAQATSEFADQKPQLSGKWIVVATNEGNSYDTVLRYLSQAPPDILIVGSDSEVPSLSVRVEFPVSEQVCEKAEAYVRRSLSGEGRAAAEMYVEFLKSHGH